MFFTTVYKRSLMHLLRSVLRFTSLRCVRAVKSAENTWQSSQFFYLWASIILYVVSPDGLRTTSPTVYRYDRDTYKWKAAVYLPH